MVLLCFVLDLRILSPFLIEDLKQSILRLSNLYAVSSLVDSLTDRIGLCYILKDRISGNDQLKIAYTPSRNFCLRDFHQAVNSLPLDAFAPEIDESGAISCRDLKLSSVLCDRALYSWGARDIMRKAIVLSSCFPEDMDTEVKKTLVAAADKCVSVEFLLLEQKASNLSCTQEKINRFLRCISDLDNCSFQTCIPDGKSLHGLEKRWLQDLKDDTGESLQAQFIFKSNLVGSVNKIFCNFTAAANQIVDGFSPCRTCRCHGIPLRNSVKNTTEQLQCSVTNQELEKYDVNEDCVKVGNETILFLPSIQSIQKVHPISSQVGFTVIERTNLASLSEGLILGRPYIVSPSTCHEMEAAPEEMDQPDLNTQIFQGLCCALNSVDQGLVCFSNCNLDTMTVVEFQCYYILQPSENGPMLLRRLAGSEEILPISSISQYSEYSVASEIEISVKNALLQIESTDYNPLVHSRGFHQKLNLIVKESLQFGSLTSNTKETTCEVSSVVPDSVIPIAQKFPVIMDTSIEEVTHQALIGDEEDKATASITKEWEELVVTEVGMKSSPVLTTPKPNIDCEVLLSPLQGNNNTSRILERLEVPRKMRAKVVSPSVVIRSPSPLSQKKPLLPFPTGEASGHQTFSSSQLMKPSFQRLKRKHK